MGVPFFQLLILSVRHFSYTVLLAVKKYGISVVSGLFAVFYYNFSVICLGPTPFFNL